MSEFEERIQHTDVQNAIDQQALFVRDEEIAKRNLEESHPDNSKNLMYARHLAYMQMVDRTRRGAHHHRYKLMTRAAMYAPLFEYEEANFPEASLLDLDRRTSTMSEDDMELAKVYGGKGISAELGHIDQLGDWDAARPLDAAIRTLPGSTNLENAGFVFGDTYNSKEHAKVTYKFHLTDYGSSPIVRAVRRRAAADILTEAGHEYEIVKSASFMVDEAELTQAQLKKLHEVKRRSSSDADEISSEAGLAIVEPFIADRYLRQRSTAVLAIGSLYFALRRH